jgi:hypothetical protein
MIKAPTPAQHAVTKIPGLYRLGTKRPFCKRRPPSLPKLPFASRRRRRSNSILRQASLPLRKLAQASSIGLPILGLSPRPAFEGLCKAGVAGGVKAFWARRSDARFGEGFWTPAPAPRLHRRKGPASESLPRRKPRGGRALEGATYGDLRVVDGAAGSVLKRWGEDCVDRKDDGELVRSCRCEA